MMLTGAEKALESAGVRGLVVTDAGGFVEYVELRRADGHAAGKQFRCYVDGHTTIAALVEDLKQERARFARMFPTLA